MKKIVLLALTVSIIVNAQIPVEKSTEQLKRFISNSQQDSEVLVWIIFTDKGPDAEESVSSIQSLISEKSLQRRSKVLPKTSLTDQTDLPIYSYYIDQVQSLGFRLKQKSKWFNAVSGYVPVSKLNSISGFPFVKKIDLVARLPRSYEQNEKEFQIDLNEKSQQKVANPNVYDYGYSLTQLEQINVPALHNLGYTGQGVTICLMDAGFSRLSHEVFSSMNIIAAYDFVNNDPGVGDSTDLGTGSHGTATLSVIGGFKEGKLIGPAFDANFILAKTENTFSETPVEEDNWIAALEWADSIGVDITSTSLGYTDFDAPFIDYTWENMDGNTARITVAADLAVKKGILVFNSAGNGGFNSTNNTLVAPADGDSVIAVGAVTSLGTRSSFSSVGNTVDGRIKPDIMAMGSGVAIAGSSSDIAYSSSNGTSFSCPLAAGAAALILSLNHNLTPIQVRDVMRNTASQNQNPNREYGWGIIDVLSAVNASLPVELINFTAAQSNNVVSLSWTTATETNNYGFSIERASANSDFTEIGFIGGAGNSTSYKYYNYEDEINIAGKYFYRLKQIDLNGTYEYSSEVEVIITGASDFILYQNYPNPFNPLTKIKYSVPFKANIELRLYDILGNKVGQIFEGTVDAGIHEATISTNDFSYQLSSGIYFVKLVSEGFQKSIKIILAK